MSNHLNRIGAPGRRLLATALLAMAVAALLTLGASGTPAQAQSPTGNAPVPHDLPSTSPLIPDGLGVGDRFRLIHLTNRQVDVSQEVPVAYYNRFAVNDAGRHPETYHPFLAAQYRVAASDSATTIEANTATHGEGVPVYWLNGTRIADGYNGLRSGDWNNADATDALGRPHPNPGAVVWFGPAPSSELSEFYVISPVFTVVDPGDIVPPAKAANLTATAAPNAVTISWQPSEGATGYWIQRRTPGGDFGDDWTMRVTTAAQYVDGTVEPSRTYEYRVRAHANGALSKCCTPAVSARAPGLPARVQSVGTSPHEVDGTETVMLSWQRVTKSDYPVVGYIIRRSERRDAGWVNTREIEYAAPRPPRQDNDGRVRYLDTGAQVSAEVEYRYQVKAVSAVGQSRKWSQAVISLEDYRPAKVEGLTAGDADGGRLNLTWTEPDGHGNAIVDYEHAYRYGRAGNYQRMTGHPGTGTEMTTAPMVAGAVVYFKVRAINRYGRGPWSEHAETTVPGILVDEDWAAAPEGIGAGDSFRLMFVTSEAVRGTQRSINAYNSHAVKHAAENGDLEPYAPGFKALASAGFVSASDNTSTDTRYGGVPVYWVGGDRIADDYHDLYDGSWANVAARDESGNAVRDGQVWTGTEFDGTYYPSFDLGNPQARVGLAQSGSTGEEISAQNLGNSQERPLYGLSPVFTIAGSSAEPE